jgi:ribonuclease Z
MYLKRDHNPFRLKRNDKEDMTQLELIFLGTGGSWPTVQRNVTSIALKRGGDVLLFDCGEGTQRQIQKSSLSYMQISRIFISHFHGDHFLGLSGLLQTMQLNDRKDPVHIYGPAGMDELAVKLVTLGYFKPTFPIFSHEVYDKDSISFEDFYIDVLSTDHGVPSVAYRYREPFRPGKFDKPKALALGIPEGPLFSKLQRGDAIELSNGKKIFPEMVLGKKRPGRTIVISGDTKPVDSMVSFAEHADVLIHEATFDESLKKRANDYGHSTAKQAAEIAAKAKVDQLVLTHLSPRYFSIKQLKKDAEEVFSPVIIPRDLDVLSVKLKQ